MGFIDDLKHIASDINGALDKNVNNIGVGPQGINRESYNGEVKQPVDMNNPDGLAGLGAVNASRDSVVDLASTVEAGATGPRAMFTPDMVFDSNGQLVHRNQPQQQGQQQGQSQDRNRQGQQNSRQRHSDACQGHVQKSAEGRSRLNSSEGNNRGEKGSSTWILCHAEGLLSAKIFSPSSGPMPEGLKILFRILPL